MSGYLLTDDDRALVEAVSGDVPVAQRYSIIAIHETQLARNRERLAWLRGQVEAIERAVALREASLLLLRNPPQQTGDDNG